jgi:hypothetical protein
LYKDPSGSLPEFRKIKGVRPPKQTRVQAKARLSPYTFNQSNVGKMLSPMSIQRPAGYIGYSLPADSAINLGAVG